MISMARSGVKSSVISAHLWSSQLRLTCIWCSDGVPGRQSHPLLSRSIFPFLPEH